MLAIGNRQGIFVVMSSNKVTQQKSSATFLDGILIDCGMPSRAIVPYMKKLRLVLLTHIHCDHFKPSALRRIYSERPSVRYVCGEHLVGPLIDAGIPPVMIDVVSPGQIYDYGKFEIEPVELVHNVPNFGYKIRFSTGESAIYATDTNSLDGIEAKDYISCALAAMLNLGSGSGPMNHAFDLQGEYAQEVS